MDEQLTAVISSYNLLKGYIQLDQIGATTHKIFDSSLLYILGESDQINLNY